MDEMSARERVLAALRRRPVDRVPCSPSFNPLTAAQRQGKWEFPWPPASPADGRAKEVEHLVEVLGVDAVVSVAWPPACPADVSWRAWAEGDMVHKVYTTAVGEIHASVRVDERWPYGEDIPFFHDFIAHYVEPWLTSEHDLECLKHILRPPDSAAEVRRTWPAVDRQRALADRFGLATVAHVGAGLTGMMQLCGAEQVCLMTIEQPGLVDAYLEFEHRANLRNIEIAADLGVDVIRRNGFYETCDFYSPAMLDRFLARRLQAEAGAAHQGGMAMAYTLHTGVMPMLDYLAGLDFDCVLHLDIAFEGHDIRAIRGKLGDRKSFWTGPSSTFHIWADDPQVVRRAVRETFDVFGRTGLLLSQSPSSHPIMPWRNTLAMIDEWRKLRST